MRFKIDDTSFAFLNCHLKSGEGNVAKRVEMLQTILSSAFVEQKGMPGLDKHSIVMVFGDMNFRVQCDYQTAINAFMSNDYRFLLAHDELNYLWQSTHLQEKNPVFQSSKVQQLLSSLLEGQIQFPPTYKYQVGSSYLDPKLRVPSYTDRILFQENVD